MIITHYSLRIPFWNTYHFKSGKFVGMSLPACYEGFVHRDQRGRLIGKSIRNFVGELNHYDRHGRCTGYSRRSGIATITHFSSRGHRIGKTFSILGLVLISTTPNTRLYFPDFLCYNSTWREARLNDT